MSSTPEQVKLFNALIKEGVPVELEKWDGYKHIDIAIPESKLNIEIDGKHHNYSTRQALADLKRTYYSFKKGYFTLRIPNSIIRNEFDKTVDLVLDLIDENNKQLDESEDD